MTKRKAISTALHSELTEYHSLIRSLRANSQLDVASHLGRAVSSQGGSRKELDDGDNYLNPTERNVTSEPQSTTERDGTNSSHDVSPSKTTRSISPTSDDQSRKRRRVHSPQYHKDNIWTRWPLLVEDVHIPEWSFHDEMGVLANNAMKVRHTTDATESPSSDEDSALALEEQNSSFLPHLADAASNYLSTILALLMAHVPNRAWSMQNRVDPMDWLTVLNVLSSCRDPNVADLNIIRSVQSRMEALLGPTDDEDATVSCHTKGTDPRSDRAILACRMYNLTEARRSAKDELSELAKTLFVLAKPPTGVT